MMVVSSLYACMHVTCLFLSHSNIIVCFQIILPNTVCDGSTKAKLFQLLAEEFGESTLSTVQRKYFNENKGSLLCMAGA